jgi:hypothetical protein
MNPADIEPAKVTVELLFADAQARLYALGYGHVPALRTTVRDRLITALRNAEVTR